MKQIVAALAYIVSMAGVSMLAAWGLHGAILAESPDGEYAHDVWYILPLPIVVGFAAIAAALIRWHSRSVLVNVLVCVAWIVLYFHFAIASTWELAAVGGSTWKTHELLAAYAFPALYFWIVAFSGLLTIVCLNFWYRGKVIAHAGY